MKKFVLLLFVTTLINAQGYLKVSGKNIVDGNGENYILRGMGLGGWMLQEGYMLKTSSFAGTQHEIRAKIESLIGTTRTDDFYEKWYENHFAKTDADKLAEWGFNSIRLPMHYKLFTLPIEDEPVAGQNTWLDKGFKMTDQLLQWCEENEMYLILDLHAAPGGQGKDANISDYDDSKPSLWESEANRAKTVALWKKLAERYKDEPWIGGYDLINEPNWELPGNTLLRELYIDITNVIREVDNNHILFIEGNWFATDFNGLTPKWDDNMAYSFHKYWNGNDQGSIGYLITIRNNENVPLYLGETGENSNAWFKDCVELMESNNIGWAWWPQKKIDNIVGPLSAPMASGYQQLLNYWSGSGSRPSEDAAYAALLQQAENLKFENCSFQPGVVDALFRQQTEDTSVPFKDHTIPGRIFASDYDLGAVGIAYSDVDYQNTGGPGSSVWNSGYSYRNDGVDIEECSDQLTNGYSVGWIETGEWLSYTVYSTQSGTYNLTIRYSANNSDGKILLSLDGTGIGSFIDLSSTGGWQNWKSVTIENIQVEAGTHNLLARFFFGGFNLNYFQFTPQLVDVKEESGPAEDFGLLQNYPNPFNNSTNINFSLPKDGKVLLKLFDIKGESNKVLANNYYAAGNHSVNFTSSDLSSGVYICTLEAFRENGNAAFSSAIKLVLLK